MPQPLGKTKQLVTYGDYEKDDSDARWEIIDGKIYDMTPAPSLAHAQVARELFLQLATFFRGKPCEVFIAPFDIRFPKADEPDELIKTVVQPDIVVVCDPKKLDQKGGRGAPDLVVEILSPSTASKDCIIKRALYERHGVREYWIVRPGEGTLEVFKLGKNGLFEASTTFDRTMTLAVDLFPGLTIDLSLVFPTSDQHVKELPVDYPVKKAPARKPRKQSAKTKRTRED